MYTSHCVVVAHQVHERAAMLEDMMTSIQNAYSGMGESKAKRPPAWLLEDKDDDGKRRKSSNW